MGIQTKTMKKRVSFSKAPHKVYIVDNSNRRGMWQHYALDRARFEGRISKVYKRHVFYKSSEQWSRLWNL